jgi:uncharacterized surface protein with fasciclin (FAS1) repeats
MHMRRSFSAVAVVLSLAAAGCSSSSKAARPGATTTVSSSVAPTRTVAELAAYDGKLSTFATMLNVSGVLTTVGARGPYTVFAPTNDAFAKLPHARLNALLSRAGKQDLLKLIGGDVVRGHLLVSDMKPGPLKTLSGATLTLARKGDVVTLTTADGKTAKIVSAPLLASNGVVYRTDAVFARS